ncbi:MAG: maltotransferase domain-containing protein [Rhodospirillales bacterium]
MPHAPKIYNLFPRLVGPVPDWHGHLPRIAGMGFDWIGLNPIHAPGGSGNIYALSDPWRLDPALRDGADASDETLLGDFCHAARRCGLRVMLDLVVRHVARDGRLATERPHWVRRDTDGRAAVARSPTGVTWGDLAEVAWGREEVRAEATAVWADWLRAMVRTGIAGFRCTAAADMPPRVWADLIAAARTVRPDCLFVADPLGVATERVRPLAGAGFDYVMSSARWWDFRSAWFLDQQAELARVAPTIAFPESHDTPRVAAEAGTDDPDRLAARLRFAYLSAAALGTGIMMPVGYEYGFRRRLDPVRTVPGDWEDRRVDLTGFLAAANAMKASVAALNVETPIQRATAPGSDVVGLVRRSGGDGTASALILINPDPAGDLVVDGGHVLFEACSGSGCLDDVTPHMRPLPLEPGRPLPLAPLEVRVFEAAANDERPSGLGAEASAALLASLAPARVSIEAVRPEIDGGRFAVKRAVGDVLEVSADIFTDGHETIGAQVLFREHDRPEWRTAPMVLVDNDRWAGRLPLARNTRYLYTVEAWRDPFASWRSDVGKTVAAGQSVALELAEGRRLVGAARDAADGEARRRLDALVATLDAATDDAGRLAALRDECLAETMRRYGPRETVTRHVRDLEVVVDRRAARFAAWYELFPRSTGEGTRHGTFDDVIRHLPYVRDMGFDVLYVPPIHPIGRTRRKGRNNTLSAGPDDPGSPYAIGAGEVGHDAVHPDLGTLEDFRRLVRAAQGHGLEIALDFAIQCSPDHPWIREHPEWFDWRPDGTLKHAENPPKTYEDIVNVHFYGSSLPSLWLALRDVVVFWVEQGVRIFRVDNPHTKPFPFWEWLIRDVQARFPDVIFLSEAFTRPKPMYRLAKLGFTQGYTYFTWRTTKADLTDYLTELVDGPPREFFRPNFFVNTPDINPVHLQTGGRAVHLVRVTLAATLSPLYGVYSGFEICEATPLPGKEEYLDAEMFEIKDRDVDRPGNIRDWIARLNRVRHDHPALQDLGPLVFMPAHDDAVLFYAKATPGGDDVVLVLANLDPHAPRTPWIELQPERVGLPADGTFRMEDMMTGETWTWTGRHHQVHLDPAQSPCRVLGIRAG